MSWNQYSEDRLNEIEQQILSSLYTQYKTFYLPVKLKSGAEEKIWTIALNTESTNIPLVMVHGFAAGIGFWCRNLDALSRDRPVYAMDLLGFGRSSRPTFSNDSSEVEKEMVDGIEVWRREMKLEKFYLLGHSMGGFLSMSYTLMYPERVAHLILAEPWGFSDHQHEKPSYWSSLIFSILHIRPLELVRMIGPLGPWLVQRVRGDIAVKFEDVVEDKSVMPNYVYHCNAQNPTGERAFYSMVWGFGWAKNPMILRIENLRSDLPITLMFGSQTWVDKSVGYKIREMRHNSFVDVQIIDDTGHHLYSEQADTFNEIVVNACKLMENDKSRSKDEIKKTFEEVHIDAKSNERIKRNGICYVENDHGESSNCHKEENYEVL
ncbi:hypothetical protein HHI36_002662 [Cryptolaemus montrouzieri]|uniref:AB hydrolase-1 domain-containing protein n=1 Tax=Cryptolaemus montrouzieri TaxID=559131 RepID=A0ABD2PB43_9CUCU